MAVNNIPSQGISLEQVAFACNSLGSLMDLLSDQNSLAMIVGNTGGLTFTKRASKVLTETCHDHPVQKLIVRTAQQYHLETGSDCKLFLILLNGIIDGVKGMLQRFEEKQIRVILLREVCSLTSLLPEIFKDVQDAHARVSNPTSDVESFLKDLEGIVLSFFESKFSLSVAKELTKLILLLNKDSDWSQPKDRLEYLISHFDKFCSEFVLPLTESRVLTGFVLNRKLIGNIASSDEGVYFVIACDWHEMYTATLVSGAFRSRPGHFGSSDTLQEHLDCVEWVLNLFKSRGISLILSPDSTPYDYEALCSQIGMQIIDSVEKEDIDSITFFMNISPLNILSDSLESCHIGHIKGVQSLMSGSYNYTHLETLTDLRPFTPKHILLGAQVDVLWKEYYEECRNCLKAVKHWLNLKVNHFPAAKQQLLKNIDSNCLKVGYDFLQDSAMSSSNASFDLSYENHLSALCAVYVSLPLGVFEFSFKTALGNISEEKRSLFPNLYNILDLALLKVVCKNWNVSFQNFEGDKSYLKFNERMKHSLVTPIEPLLSKEIQICKIFQLIQQLLKVDAVVITK